ncbi:MAG: AmmeMemoRadiSam system radical SAM enzyme [Clostridiales bacterium]|nr:AmmeMemoRadiSam system radical SAM enzyme [Clostridiales bacterium]
MIKARFFSRENGAVICELCPHRCSIANQKMGICRQKKNEGGNLYALNYGSISSMAIDPIEKKPLYHFYPGYDILSIGGLGCNLQCKFCQNWRISQRDRVTEKIDPRKVVDKALELSSFAIAYTYNEPLIGFEYVYDIAKLARKRGLKNVLVTNGFINKEPLKKLLPLIDAMNIDLKAFTEGFYNRVCKGSLEPVKNTIKIAASTCHVELTTLVINGLNDGTEEIDKLSKWISHIDSHIPLHLSKYYPNYLMDRPATSEKTMLDLAKIAKRHLAYVYIGNMLGVDNNTYCPGCGHLLIRRGYRVSIIGIKDSKCNNCGYKIKLVN